MLAAALADLDSAELAVLTQEASARAHVAARLEFGRLAGWYHALAVTLAEEQDRRDELLEALDPDRDDEEGEIVPPAPRKDTT